MAIQNISLADKGTLDAVNAKVDVNVSSRASADTAITMVLSQRATEEGLTWALRQNGIGGALDSLGGLGNSALLGCGTFSAVLADGTARTAVLNSPAIFETILLTKYGANAIVGNSSCMSAIGASAALRAAALEYDYFIYEVLNNPTALSSVNGSSAWRESIIERPAVFAKFSGNSTFINNMMGSSASFSALAASGECMKIVCTSSVCRSAMYSKRTVTENILRASSTALNIISDFSSKLYIPAVGTNVVVFNYPVFILSKYLRTSVVTANTTTFADGTTDSAQTDSVVITLNKFATNQIITCTTSGGSYFYVQVFVI